MTEQITNNNLENTTSLLLISANYNNKQKAVVLKFYDPLSHKIVLWTDKQVINHIVFLKCHQQN